MKKAQRGPIQIHRTEQIGDGVCGIAADHRGEQLGIRRACTEERQADGNTGRQNDLVTLHYLIPLCAVFFVDRASGPSVFPTGLRQVREPSILGAATAPNSCAAARGTCAVLDRTRRTPNERASNRIRCCAADTATRRAAEIR